MIALGIHPMCEESTEDVFVSDLDVPMWWCQDYFQRAWHKNLQTSLRIVGGSTVQGWPLPSSFIPLSNQRAEVCPCWSFQPLKLMKKQRRCDFDMIVKRYQIHPREGGKIQGGWIIYVVVKHSWMLAGKWTIWKSKYIDFILKMKDFHFCMLRLLQEYTALRSTAATLQERCGRQEFACQIFGIIPQLEASNLKNMIHMTTWHKNVKYSPHA